MPETLTHLYTSESEVERVMSLTGVDLRLDDLVAGDLAAFWTELLSDATDLINQYVEYFYDPVDLANSRWVHIRATYIACHFLSARRGNPSIFRARYEQTIEELTSVFRGNLLIPRLPTKDDFTPAMTNIAVNDKFYIDKIRVHSTISSGGTSGRQSQQPYVPDYQI